MNTPEVRELLDLEFDHLRSAMRTDTRDLVQCMFASWLATLVYMAALLIALRRR